MNHQTLKEYVKELQPTVNKVLHYCEELVTPIEDMNTNGLFADWAINKEHIFYKFGNKLRISIPEQSYKISQEEKDDLFSQLINELQRYAHNEDGLSSSEWKLVYNFLCEFRHCWMTNYTDKVFNFKKEQENISIPYGTKISKDLKYIVSNERVLNNMQQIISKYIQKDKIKGTLYLSIHPLDYLSLSETNHGWRSCHALDGEYCAGNLEYMTDPSTIVCYLVTEDKDEVLPHFPEDVPWNSKAWRVLMHVDKTLNAVWLNKPYPYSNENLDNAIARKLCDINVTHSYYWRPTYRGFIQTPTNTAMQNGDYYLSDTPIALLPDESFHKINKFFKLNDNRNFYFDILQSTSYSFIPKWMSNYSAEKAKKIKIPVGNRVHCVNCGCDKFYSSSSYLCKDCLIDLSEKNCADIGHCECCGQRMSSSNYWFDNNTDERLCENCYRDRYMHCSCCGCWVSKERWDAEEGCCASCVKRGSNTKINSIETNMESVERTMGRARAIEIQQSILDEVELPFI